MTHIKHVMIEFSLMYTLYEGDMNCTTTVDHCTQGKCKSWVTVMLHLWSETTFFLTSKRFVHENYFPTTSFLNYLLDIYINTRLKHSCIFAWRNALKHFKRWKAKTSSSASPPFRTEQETILRHGIEWIKLVSLLKTGLRHGHYKGYSVKLRGLTLTVIIRQDNVSCVGRCRAILIALGWEDEGCVSNPSELPT